MPVHETDKTAIEARNADEAPAAVVQADAQGLTVRADANGLMVRSASLVRRGLRDLARDSNWLSKKVFAGRSASVGISDTGMVCAIPSSLQGAGQRLVLFDLEMNVSTMALAVPGESAERNANETAVFSWSPGSRYLVAARRGWCPKALHIFDLHSKMLLGTFGDFAGFPAQLAWSPAGDYFAAASTGGKSARLRVWRTNGGAAAAMPCSSAPTHEMGLPEGFERQTYEAEFGEEGGFSGYGGLAFSPDGKFLASVVEIRGDWADDSVAMVEAATLRKINVFHGQGHITDISWTPDGRGMIYCAAGQAYRVDLETLEAESLPFGAEFCACHPHLPLCLCFSSWLKNSAKGRLFVVDLNTLEILDEHSAENVAHLRWSGDGTKAYAATSDGMGYIYESPLI